VVITTWVMLRHFMSQARELRTGNPAEDLRNQSLAFLDILVQKLSDEIVARLAELGEEKIGRTNFYFACQKLSACLDEASRFSARVSKEFRRKRNQEIAHREQPEKWFDDPPIRIPYSDLVRVLASAVRLMKMIDRKVLGPASPYLWQEGRKTRYELIAPERAMYLLLPYLRLSEGDRMRVVAEEQAEGKIVWTEIQTTINGETRKVLVNKEWGLLLIGRQCVALAQYPLQSIESIQFGGDGGDARET
jgi:hypothetical protein